MPKNKHTLRKKRWELLRREEALHNLALEAGVPQLPRSTLTSILRAIATVVGIIATLVAVCVLILLVGWFVSVVDDFSHHLSDLPMMGFAFVLSLLLLPSISYTQRHRDLLLYPPCIIELYQQLNSSGKITVSEIAGVESPIASMPLIYRDNQAILKGKREKLAQPRDEALENVGAAIGLTVPPVPGCFSGCASIYMLGLGSFGIAVGIFMLALDIGGFSSIQSSDSKLDDIVPLTLYLAVGMVLFVHVGWRYIVHAYLERQYKSYLSRVYKQLIKQGEIIEGTATDVEQKIYQLIHYRFEVPTCGGICEGQYRLHTQITVTPGQKVTVLYLNRCVHILL